MAFAGSDLYPLSVEQYHAMIDAGILTEDDAVELVEGVLIKRMPKNPRHELVLGLVHDALIRAGWSGYSIRIQSPVTLADGEPEPDVSIVRGDRRAYAVRHPAPADVACVIEVSQTTQAIDRGCKLQGYARAAIALYWVIDPEAQVVEVYTQPSVSADGVPGYGKVEKMTAGQNLTLELPGEKPVHIAVSEILA
jgi:Uma2 family endonuclease